MKKKCKKILILIICILMFFLNYSVKAASTASDIWDVGREFLEDGSQYVGMTSEQQAIFGELLNTKSKFEELIDFLWGIGLLVILITTVVLGIKYMLVLPSERSRIKQATTPYIIGVTIIFGALTIWKFIIVVLDGSL